jgi:hypothetical protein
MLEFVNNDYKHWHRIHRYLDYPKNIEFNVWLDEEIKLMDLHQQHIYVLLVVYNQDRMHDEI